jgi:2-dehydropantoate 2-reductase
LRREGLRIVSPHGNATLNPQLITADRITQPYDAVLLTVKGFQLEAALADLARAVGPETMILPVLNGMRHMDILAKHFSDHNLVGCALKVATVIEEDGRIVQLMPLQDLAYGELDGRMTPRIQALNAFMRGAGFDARLSDAIRREMWEKWILLASVGAITCLMRGTIGEVEASPGGIPFVLHLLDEAVAVVTVVGTAPSEGFLSAARDQLTAKDSPFASSMYRDLQQGRRIEVEEIIGDLLRRGTKAGLSTPLLATAYTHLALYQNRIIRPDKHERIIGRSDPVGGSEPHEEVSTAAGNHAVP